MSDKYQNKYRVKSHRMPSWDYSSNVLYFLTIVTQNRVVMLGEVNRADVHSAEHQVPEDI